ncbi:plasmid stabilization protein [Streptomyces albidus (ex Kaewkla and Franco 2022)]|uniref:plasmid stabilization protein n=1 Tax=Streptomyces albidus (ex Kaewkla and Franco 2022) TaxID=722709 RepID=UPI0015EFB4F9|nr:plasmid stabilization protein [Streptomyces albidus (ex Kaewkla and Franco 2022)]
MPAGSNAKRERQYEHIKAGAQQRGASPGRAKEIASRTVNKERARTGEADRASRTSTKGKSASARGGKRSGNRMAPKSGPTRDQLYNEARQRGIQGRSSMNKRQLEKALGR